MSKPGPKPKPENEKRKHPVTCRLTDAELVLCDGRRGALTRGEWMRIAALKRLPPLIPEINRTTWGALARTAANLNQIAKAINEGRVQGWPHEPLIELYHLVQRLRRELLGVKSDDGEET